MNNKGQTVFTEYVVIFFIVVAAAATMTVFVQRALQGRIRDAKNYLISTVDNTAVMDSNFVHAAHGRPQLIGYEPYYEQYNAVVANNINNDRGTMPGNPQSLGAIYLQHFREHGNNNATSIQLPALCSGPTPPLCCNDGSGCLTCRPFPGHECGVDTCGGGSATDTHNCVDLYGTSSTGWGCTGAGQCIRCACPTYSVHDANYSGTFTYTAVCGPDTCGNPNGCNAITASGITCTAANQTCGSPSAAAGVCVTWQGNVGSWSTNYNPICCNPWARQPGIGYNCSGYPSLYTCGP